MFIIHRDTLDENLGLVESEGDANVLLEYMLTCLMSESTSRVMDTWLDVGIISLRHRVECLCVYYWSTYYKVVRLCGGGGQWRTCATRDYEPRPVWTSLPITH
jgi:hypothetical protein